MNIPYSYVHCFLAAKFGSDIARLVSNPELLNDPLKKAVLKWLRGGINPPQLVHVCYLFWSAITAFPGQTIYIARQDVDAAYTRIASHPFDCLHMIFPFIHLGEPCVAVPLVSTFGCQDSNYQFQVISDVIVERSIARISA
jgi:hypothetical protein